jgi:hypothetical protein
MASGIMKWALEQLKKSHYSYYQSVAPKQVANIMSKNVSKFALRGLPLIENPQVEKLLNSSFNNSFGGVHVLVAPSGSGKTTYLRSYANRFIEKGGFVQYFGSELQTRKQFFGSFGDENRANDLFEVIPKKSVIIIDEIEHMGILSEDIKGLLKHLAFESRRVAGVSVIVSTASNNLAGEIVRLNGNDKFRMNGSVSDWRWTPDMIDKYLEAPIFQNVGDVTVLKKLAYSASCPAFLYSCADLLADNGDLNSSILFKRADKFARTWEEFEKINFNE